MAKPIISADSHITEPPDTYVDRIDRRFRDRAPHVVRDATARRPVRDRRDGPSPSPWGSSLPRASPPRSSACSAPSSRTCTRAASIPRRASPSRTVDGVSARGALPDGRHDALQPPRLRLQEGLLRRLQPLDRRVLRRPPRPAHRRRADRDALGGGGHRRPPPDQGARPARRDDARQPRRRRLRRSRATAPSTRRRSTSACRSPSTSSRASRTASRRAGPSSTPSCRSSAAARTSSASSSSAVSSSGTRACGSCASRPTPAGCRTTCTAWTTPTSATATGCRRGR